MKVSRTVVLVVVILLIAMAAVIATLLNQNNCLRDTITQLEATQRQLVLSSVQQDPAYHIFKSQFPDSDLTVEAGVAKWNHLAERTGERILYILQFDPKAGTRIMESEIVTTDQMIHAKQKELSLEEFTALTETKEPNNEIHRTQ